MQLSTCCWELIKDCSHFTSSPITLTQSWNRCVSLRKEGGEGGIGREGGGERDKGGRREGRKERGRERGGRGREEQRHIVALVP